jgi:ABC-type transporter Mla MlaB component
VASWAASGAGLARAGRDIPRGARAHACCVMKNAESIVSVSSGRLVLGSELGVEGRRAFIEAACAAIAFADTAGTELELDCSSVECVGPIDDPVIGMLVTLARAAQRRGTRVVLVNAPRRMRAQLESADVGHFFDWQR